MAHQSVVSRTGLCFFLRHHKGIPAFRRSPPFAQQLLSAILIYLPLFSTRKKILRPASVPPARRRAHAVKVVNAGLAARRLPGAKQPVFGGGLGRGESRVILHVDMDCFFVSVLVKNRPELRDKPVAVAHNGTLGSAPRVVLLVDLSIRNKIVDRRLDDDRESRGKRNINITNLEFPLHWFCACATSWLVYGSLAPDARDSPPSPICLPDT